MNNTLKLIARSFAAIGILALAGAASIFLSTKNFRQNAAVTHGKVIDMIAKRDRSSTTYAPVVTYRDGNGVSHTYISNVSSNPPAYAIGEGVNVFYNKNNPEDVQLDGDGAYIGTIILGVLGLIFTVVGVAILVIHSRQQQSQDWLVQNGRVVAADLVSVSLNTQISYNNRNPYVIYCQWLDNNTRKVYSFRSQSLWFNPETFLENRTKVDVYIDPNNPKKHLVDTSFLPQQA